MASTASDYFGSMVREYDSLIRRAVACYDEMLRRLVEYLPEQAGSVLELGCGTGNYTLALAERYPQAELVLVDGSREMLDLTHERLGHPLRVRKIEQRFEELDLRPEWFEVVTSCIAVHHVEDKLRLFRRLRRILRPGGAIVICDQMSGVTEDTSRIHWDRMVDFWRQPGNCTPKERQSLADHAHKHDHYESVPAHLNLLNEAGFHDVDCVWRDTMWAIVTASG